VYLTNTRTRAVKSYIVSNDGAYRFPELSPNIDYEVYAQYKGLKSETKTVSQFDDRPQVNIVLRIDVKVSPQRLSVQKTKAARLAGGLFNFPCGF